MGFHNPKDFFTRVISYGFHNFFGVGDKGVVDEVRAAHLHNVGYGVVGQGRTCTVRAVANGYYHEISISCYFNFIAIILYFK